MNLYWSDAHILHANIIRYTARPFASVEAMDEVLMDAFLGADAAEHSVYHLGDWTFRPLQAFESYGAVEHPDRHVHLSGNHDKTSRLDKPEFQAAYGAWFGDVIGTEKSWKSNTLLVEDELEGKPVRLLLSHHPQQDLKGAHFNLYGHVHNTPYRAPERFALEYPWLAEGSEKHLNVSVEVIGYRPRPLSELLEFRTPRTRR